MLRNIAVAAGLVGALAVSGAFLVAQAKPETATKASPGLQSKAAGAKTFDATCSSGEAIDTRIDPAWVGQSFAKDGCVAPVLPASIDGYSATRKQIDASTAAQKKYAAAADAYQQCIIQFVTARRTKAEAQNKTLDVALVVIENHRVTASEASKAKSKALLNNTIRAFNEAGSEDCK